MDILFRLKESYNFRNDVQHILRFVFYFHLFVCKMEFVCLCKKHFFKEKFARQMKSYDLFVLFQ